jgi:3-oxoacyl-(acyl-carrier-protein) synthase
MNQRLVITGVGPVSCLGIGKEATWAALQRQESRFSVISEFIGGELWGSYPLATVADLDASTAGICAKRVSAMTQLQNNRDLLLFAIAAKLALEDGNLSYAQENNRIGMVMAHENPGFDEYTRQIWRAMEAHPAPQTDSLSAHIKALYAQVEGSGYQTHSFVLLQQLTALLNTHGPVLSLNNACSSGLFALETAAQWLRSGHADAMIVVCGDSPRLITRYLWLKAARSCASDGIMRPFDKNRNGFVLGEGAGAVILETVESANKRGAPVYTEYLGGAFRSDAWKLTVPAVKPNLYQEAIEQALQKTDTEVSAIDLLVPHGAATAIQDRYEAMAITRVFGANLQRMFVTALKPFVGHTLAGSSLVELVLSLIGLSHGVILPTLNWTTPDEKLGLDLVRRQTQFEVGNWIKTATGFGGFNAACVFSQPGRQS